MRASASRAPAGAIIAYPDVKRMLLTMRALTGAARAICYATGIAIDRSLRAKTEAARKAAHDRASLLTRCRQGVFDRYRVLRSPRSASRCHGGMGYIEETGAAQHYPRCAHRRDLRRHERNSGHRPCRRARCRWKAARPSRSISTSCGAPSRSVRSSNAPASGETAARLGEAVDSLERATRVAAGRRNPPTRRLPVPRPICVCSAMPRAAVCWPRKRCASLRAGDGALAVRSSRAFSPKTSLFRRSGLERSVIEGADSIIGAQAALAE